MAQAEFFNEPPVALKVTALEILEEAPALAHHHQQAAPAGMVLGVAAEMARERVDALGEERDLQTGRPGVVGSGSVALDHGVLVKAHETCILRTSGAARPLASAYIGTAE